MRSVRRATCTRVEPVSLSCTLYFWSAVVLSKAMSPEKRCRPTGGLNEGKLVEHGKLACAKDDVKGGLLVGRSDALGRLRRPARLTRSPTLRVGCSSDPPTARDCLAGRGSDDPA